MNRVTLFPSVVAALLLLTGCRTGDRHRGVTLGSPAAALAAPLARVVSVEGSPEVSLTGRPASWTDVRVGYEVTPGAVLVTGFSENLKLKLASGSILTVKPASWVEVDAGPDGTPILRTLRGAVDGTITGGPVEFQNSCGASIFLSPNPGMQVPFAFGDRRREDMAHLIGLGAPGWAWGDWSMNLSLNTFPHVARRPVGPDAFNVPEPRTMALGALGAVLLAGTVRSRRRVASR